MEREIVTTVPLSKPRGVVFAFHGCLQFATELGFKSASCPNCHGAQLASRRSDSCLERLLILCSSNATLVPARLQRQLTCLQLDLETAALVAADFAHKLPAGRL